MSGSIYTVSLDSLLEGLPPARVPDAIRWAGSADDRFRALVLTRGSAWGGAQNEVRAIARSSSESTRSRVIAYHVLFRTKDATAGDAEACTSLLRELAQGPATLAEARWFTGRTPDFAGDYGPEWNLVVASLLEDAAVPNALTEDLALSRSIVTGEDRAVLRRISEAASARLEASAGGAAHARLAPALLGQAKEGRASLDTPLLLAWLGDDEAPLAECVTAVLRLEARSGGVAQQALEPLVSRLMGVADWREACEVADQILRLPGDQPVQRLLEITPRQGEIGFMKHVEARAADRLQMREARERWSTLSSGGSDLEGAKVKVLALLDSPIEDVRVEAIRGLGTLGAVEAMPRLIEVVGTGSEVEKAAAREALDLLHAQARNRRSMPSESSDPEAGKGQ